MPYVRVNHVTIDFPIYQGGSRSLKKALLAHSTSGNIAKDAFDRINVRALQDIAFGLDDGDRVALLGRNGAGKTTLLKVLAGIYQPTFGYVVCSGQVTALIGAGVGLDVDATGYDNIILRGMYMNIHPREMEGAVDDIAEFTELGSYLDMPVRTYSSGMMVRLAFGIATCMKPEILLMDEWLGAGDAPFLAKAHKRMEDFVGGSRIMVLASHSMDLLQQWCNRGIFLHQGRVMAQGDIADAIAAYQRAVDAGELV